MPNQLSPLATSAALALESEHAWLVTLEIAHPLITNGPLRLVNNTENVVSGGQTYQAYPFEVVLAAQEDNRAPEVTLRIDNVDQRLVEAIRSIGMDPPSITLRLILASTPNTVELQIDGLVLRNVDFDQFTITGTLYADELISTRFPADVISVAAGYWGLFPQ
jgi:hypothetical protein